MTRIVGWGLVATLAGCPSVARQYEIARVERAPAVGPAVGAPDLVVQLSEGTLRSLLMADHARWPAAAGELPAGTRITVVRVVPTLDEREPRCAGCIPYVVAAHARLFAGKQLLANLVAEVPVDGSVAVVERDGAFAIDVAIAPEPSTLGAVRTLPIVGVAIPDDPELGTAISRWLQRFLLGVRPIEVARLGGPDTGVSRVIAAGWRDGALRVDALTHAAAAGVAGPDLAAVEPTDHGFSVDLAASSLVWLAHARALEPQLGAGAVAVPSAASFDGDAFTADVRWWNPAGGWWRDVAISGTWGVSPAGLAMTPATVVETGHSRGAAPVEPAEASVVPARLGEVALRDAWASIRPRTVVAEAAGSPAAPPTDDGSDPDDAADPAAMGGGAWVAGMGSASGGVIRVLGTIGEARPAPTTAADAATRRAMPEAVFAAKLVTPFSAIRYLLVKEGSQPAKDLAGEIATFMGELREMRLTPDEAGWAAIEAQGDAIIAHVAASPFAAEPTVAKSLERYADVVAAYHDAKAGRAPPE